MNESVLIICFMCCYFSCCGFYSYSTFLQVYSTYAQKYSLVLLTFDVSVFRQPTTCLNARLRPSSGLVELRDCGLWNARGLAAFLRPELQRHVWENLEKASETASEMQGMRFFCVRPSRQRITCPTRMKCGISNDWLHLFFLTLFSLPIACFCHGAAFWSLPCRCTNVWRCRKLARNSYAKVCLCGTRAVAWAPRHRPQGTQTKAAAAVVVLLVSSSTLSSKAWIGWPLRGASCRPHLCPRAARAASQKTTWKT